MSAGSASPTVYRVGLTGGLASGKSTVASWLRDAGFQVIDADRLVAELYRPGAPGAAAVRRLFGDGVLTPRGGVDHAALAARVFSDPAARQALEQAIHPLVRRAFEEIAAPRAAAGPGTATAVAGPTAATSSAGAELPAATPPVVVLEATLLVEAGYEPGFDLIVTVEGDPEVRLRRAAARGLDAAAARARLAAQGDGARRRQGAHRVIDNDGTLADLRHEVDSLIADVRRAAAARSAAPASASASEPQPAREQAAPEPAQDPPPARPPASRR